MGKEVPQITESLPQDDTKVPANSQNSRDDDATEIKYAEENITPTFEEVDLVSSCSSPDSMENTEDTEGFHDDSQLDSLANAHQLIDHDKPDDDFEKQCSDVNHIDNQSSAIKNNQSSSSEPNGDSVNISSDVKSIEKHPNPEPMQRSQSCISNSSSNSKAWKQIAAGTDI